MFNVTVPEGTAPDTVLDDVFEATNDGQGVVYLLPLGPIPALNSEGTFVSYTAWEHIS